MKFTVEKKGDGLARAGKIETAHGGIETPAYIAPATKAALKALSNTDAKNVGTQAMMMNTYHLMLEPGADVIAEAGGLHKFSNWSGPIMTDSGGFQAFSLGEAYGTGISKFISWEREDGNYEPSQHEKRARADDNGVKFYSHVDGSEHYLTPEKSIEIQHIFDSDILMAFDECVSPHADRQLQEKAIERTHRWAERSLARHLDLGGPSGLFGIVQGGRYEDLRKKSAREISSLGFDGYGIGGSFVKEDMGTAVRWVAEELPEDKPRHLLGVGEPEDVFEAVVNGIDTFDCVASTRKARTGTLYTKAGQISVTNARFRNLFEPIEKGCACYTCQNHTCAYLHHLFRAHELLAYNLASIHNLYFITNLAKQIRQAILNNSFEKFRTKFLTKYTG